jgi:hypothetical protein
VVLSQDELAAVFRGMQGEHRLFARLLYGTGMRLSEGLRLRVKDVDFAHRAVIVRHGKGGKDRMLMLPQTLVPALREQLPRAHALWSRDHVEGPRGRRDAECAGAQVPAGRLFVALVLGLPSRQAFSRSGERHRAAPPHVRPDLPTPFQASRARPPAVVLERPKLAESRCPISGLLCRLTAIKLSPEL